MFRVAVLSFLVHVVLAPLALAQLPSGVVDTQPNGETPPSPKESLAKITVPNGFSVTLFAGEPDVHQPIAMQFDDRGRLWVAECFSYPAWRDEGKDRILIFEDADNDGKFDRRKVFADKLSNVTGMALGHGGVWVCSAPNLILIPDANLDDVPDGPAVVKLDGWNDTEDGVEHNIFNGMKWGPDGWMYGGHGILDTSYPGTPSTPRDQRDGLNCGIWRYHPVRDEFEIVAHGTTNPWGIDFDELGQGFFTNSVINHFWHLIPGARYRRMYGAHFNPYTYTLVESCADHFHWGDGRWQDSRSAVGSHGEAGGGHAHVGALIYQGGRWPERYRGTLLTANLHGNRLNNDMLQKKGSGYVAKHGDDFLRGNDPWFRGIGIKCGPDGNVFVSDWTDLGECHDHDGSHRSSGRIYKVSYGPPAKLGRFNLAASTDDELFGLIDHENKWYWERARRLLHERAASGKDMTSLVAVATTRIHGEESQVIRLRLASAIALMGGANQKFLDRLLSDTDDHLQAWAVRHMSQETKLGSEQINRLVRLAEETKSLRVRLELAIALQRSSAVSDLAAALLRTFPTVSDQNLLPMTWYGIEPLVPDEFETLLLMGQENEQLSEIRQFMVRRVLADEKNPTVKIDQILALAQKLKNPAMRDVLLGLQKALVGRSFSKPPMSWKAWTNELNERNDTELSRLTTSLGVKFNDPHAIETLEAEARDRKLDVAARQVAIASLSSNKTSRTRELLQALLFDEGIRLSVIEQLQNFNQPSVARSLLGIFPKLSESEKLAAVNTLCSSQMHVTALLSAIESGSIPVSAIKPIHAAKIGQMRNKQVRRKLRKLWGDVRNTPREAQKKIADWKAVLTSEKMSKPDLKNGKKVYFENCGKCHKLFGEGGDIGPELTGSDRRNLDYILQNVITPSAVVGKQHRMQSVILDDGRVISGAILEQTAATIVVQTVDKKITIERADINSIESTELSLMPEGQFDVLPQEHVRDLVGYLRES